MNTAAFSFCKTWLASDYLEMSIFTASQYFVGAQAWSSMFFWGHLFFFRLNSFTLPADDVVIVISWTQLLVFVEVNGSPAFKTLAAAWQLHPKQVYPGIFVSSDFCGHGVFAHTSSSSLKYITQEKIRWSVLSNVQVHQKSVLLLDSVVFICTSPSS